MTFTETFTVQVPPPFDFDLCAQIFSSGDPEIRTYAKGKFHQVLRLNSSLVLISLTSKGNVEQPKLQVTLKSNNSLSKQDTQIAKELVHFIFNLDFDLCSFYQDIEKEPTMHKIAM
jgi:hypothetical protein